MTPIWNFHGDADGIVSIFWSKMVFTALDSIGVQAIYPEDFLPGTLDFYLSNGIKHLHSEYKNGGHEIWAQSYNNPKLIEWLLDQRLGSQEYQKKFAFKVSPDKAFARANRDTLRISTHINNPENQQVDAFALITNESGSFADSIPLFDDGHHADAEAADELFCNQYPAPSFEDIFQVTVRTVDRDSNDFYLKTPIEAVFTKAGPLKIEGFSVFKITPAGKKYLAELELELTNNSHSKTISQASSNILGFYPENIEVYGKNPVYQFGDLEPGQKVRSSNKMNFFFVMIQRCILK